MRRACVSMRHLVGILCKSNKTYYYMRHLCNGETFKRFADDERRVKHGGHHVPSSPSPPSTSKGYSWAIYFYPDGKSPKDNASYVSLFIALANEGTDVRALFELTLVDQSGNGKHKVHSHFERALEKGPYTLKYRGSVWGYKRFFRRSGLESSDYLKDNSLLVRCCVGVVKSCTEGPRDYNISSLGSFLFLSAVMQTDGFDYLKKSCPSLLTELLEYVARRSEHSVIALGHRKEVFADGCDANGRRVKQRLH
ncbi:hypothetical protein YC2023_021519 [Brassica napus]